MATSRAANLVEKAVGHEQELITTDVADYAADNYGDSTQSMKARTWQGNNTVKLGESRWWSNFALNNL
jgi:hypothetical protein